MDAPRARPRAMLVDVGVWSIRLSKARCESALSTITMLRPAAMLEMKK